ncbi:alpha/beta fold hydrolase [Croceiramulus getboli]|nr:caspase family protein [Flavobacteriaceae bacterium YJPT1-3]
MAKLSNAYALLIGVGNDLPVTVHDATAIYNILADDSLAGYPEDNITLLTEEQATRKGILEAFDQLIEKTNEDSSVLLFYSGHGGFYEPWQQFYLVPNNFDPDEYEDTWVKAEELREKISALSSRRLIFLLDCCHAAGMTRAVEYNKEGAAQNKLDQPEGLAQTIDNGAGMSILSSCREDQLSYIMDGDHNSLFTKCILEVLNGLHKSHFEEPYIRISEVVQYVFKKVPERNEKQRPYANLQIYDDFILSHIPDSVLERLPSEVKQELSAQQKDVEEVVTVFRESEKANSVILFLHGFTGEAAATFGEIPQLIMDNPQMDGWDLFPMGYSPNVDPELGKEVWATVDDIEKIADYLATSIKYKFGKYDRVALVAHSLGGLVAQRALLNLPKKHQDRISHVLLFGTPSAGIPTGAADQVWNTKNKALHANGDFISTLRAEWKEQFGSQKPFSLWAIAATQDEYIPAESSLSPFAKEEQLIIEGTHWDMVKGDQPDSDTYQIISKTLANSEFYKDFVNEEEVNLLLGEYEAVVRKLLPQAGALDKRGLQQLIFALEGLDRAEEAVAIIEEQLLSKKGGDYGLLAGRYKRRYVNTFQKKDGDLALEFYEKGLHRAEERNDDEDIFYYAINLAFMHLVLHEDRGQMKAYAKLAIEAAERSPFDSLWKLATLGEANLYKGDFENAMLYYSKAAALADLRQKVSIHGNAYKAYTILMNTSNPKDPFISFLKTSFLS